jgi:hypothetical protein
MLLFKRKRLLLVSAGCVILMLLTPTHGDSHPEQSYKMAQPLEVISMLSTTPVSYQIFPGSVQLYQNMNI